MPDNTSAAVLSGRRWYMWGASDDPTEQPTRMAFSPGSASSIGFPTRLRHIVHREPGLGFRRAPVARYVDGNTPVPCREMRHLKNPARLVHGVGMNKGDHGPRASHPLVIKRSIYVLRHVTPPVLMRCSRSLTTQFASIWPRCEIRQSFGVQLVRDFLLSDLFWPIKLNRVLVENIRRLFFAQCLQNQRVVFILIWSRRASGRQVGAEHEDRGLAA